MVDLSLFFPPETLVFALPGPRNPRLYVPSERPLQRWHQSSLYPASRLTARLYRQYLRLTAAAGFVRARTVRSAAWPLGEFVRDLIPSLDSVAILLARSFPDQRVTVQLWNAEGQVVGYVKYAEGVAALRRMQQEWTVLRGLPEGIGPIPLKHGPLGGGMALLMSPVLGTPPTSRLTPAEGWLDLLESLLVSPPSPIEAHPWVHRMRGEDAPALDGMLEPLAGRQWPVTVQHGDFAPWNLLEGRNKSRRVIDWEYGALQGFPYLDLIHYVLQVSGLLLRRTPEATGRFVVAYLSGHPRLKLSEAEAEALTRLAAYEVYVKSLAEGKSPEAHLQPWRRTIWQGVPWLT